MYKSLHHPIIRGFFYYTHLLWTPSLPIQPANKPRFFLNPSRSGFCRRIESPIHEKPFHDWTCRAYLYREEERDRDIMGKEDRKKATRVMCDNSQQGPMEMTSAEKPRLDPWRRWSRMYGFKCWSDEYRMMFEVWRWAAIYLGMYNSLARG